MPPARVWEKSPVKMRVRKTAVFTESPVFQNRGNVWTLQGVWALICRPVITGFEHSACSRCASAPNLTISWEMIMRPWTRGAARNPRKRGIAGRTLILCSLVFGPATMPEIQVNSAPALELTLTKHVFLRLHTSMLYNGFHCFQPWADLKALPAQKKSTKPLTFCDLSQKWI